MGFRTFSGNAKTHPMTQNRQTNTLPKRFRKEDNPRKNPTPGIHHPLSIAAGLTVSNFRWLEDPVSGSNRISVTWGWRPIIIIIIIIIVIIKIIILLIIITILLLLLLLIIIIIVLTSSSSSSSSSSSLSCYISVIVYYHYHQYYH